jgi:RHS repeat-associated protein
VTSRRSPRLSGQRCEDLGTATTTSTARAGQPLEQINGATGSVTWLHEDQLGSVRLLSDNTGNPSGTKTYDPYGTPTSTTGTVTSALGYAGQYTDAETGFLCLRARYYDPATAQFLSRDPAVAVTDEPYGYTGGDPLNTTDPLRLCHGFWCCVGAELLSARTRRKRITGGLVAQIDEAISLGSTCTYAHDGFYTGGYIRGSLRKIPPWLVRSRGGSERFAAPGVPIRRRAAAGLDYYFASAATRGSGSQTISGAGGRW